MPQPDKSRDEALERLNEELDAFTAKRATGSQYSLGSAEASGAGYRLLGELIGGVLGGLGLGWFFDRLAHTSPWGLVGGLLIGTGVSVFAVVSAARRMSEQASKGQPAPPSVPFDDDDDDK